MSTPQPEAGSFHTPQNDVFYATHRYDDLNPSNREVRLLKILPDGGTGLIECELLRAEPLSIVQGTYSALSYRAGDPAITRSIIINGFNFQAFSSLAHALAKARQFWTEMHGSKDFLLWIDQICINQLDITERSQQVELMWDIYSSAKDVMICLSTKRADDKGIQWLRSLHRDVPQLDTDLDQQYRGEESFRLPLNVSSDRFHWSRLLVHLWRNVGSKSFSQG